MQEKVNSMSLINRHVYRKLLSSIFITLLLVNIASLFVNIEPVFASPGLTPKWTRSLGSDAQTYIGPLAADINGDGKLEIVVTGGSSEDPIYRGNGLVTALDGATGNIVWQVTVGGVTKHTPFEIADINNDGLLEIVVSGSYPTVLRGSNGAIYWQNTAVPSYNLYSPVADIDGDGYYEIFVSSGLGPYNGDDYFTVLSYNGNVLRQTNSSWHPCWGGLTIGDANFDGRFELYQGDRRYGYSTSFPYNYGEWGVGCLDAHTLTRIWNDSDITCSSHTPMLADVDKDGILDVIVTHQSTGSGGLAVYNALTGSVLTTGGKYRKILSGYSASHSQPTIADIDFDGNLEIIACRSTQPKIWDLYDWKLDATLPVTCVEPPKVGDVTGDGKLDIIAATGTEIYIYSYDEVSKTYVQVDHVTVSCNAFTLVQDVDGDGYNELITTSAGGTVRCFDTSALAPNPRVRSDSQFYSERHLGAAEYVPPPGPVAPQITEPSPTDGATDVPATLPQLTFRLIDYQNNKMNYTVTTNPNIGSGNGINLLNGEYAVSLSNLHYSTTYTWTVIATDGTYTNIKTFTFTTSDLPPWWNTDWQYRRTITIDHTEVSTDQTNFPVLIDLTDSGLITKAQPDGDDFVFTDASHVRLNHEIELYDSTTGHMIAWVNVPYLSSITDTTLYMYYDNPTCGNQQNPTATWDTSHKLVLHLEEKTGTQYDSTINANDGTPYNGVIQGTTDKIDGADTFDGTNDYIEIPHSNTLAGYTEAFTTSFWIRLEDTSRRQAILNKYNSGTGQRAWFIEYNPVDRPTRPFGFYASQDGINYREWYATFVPTANTWYYVTAVWEANAIPKFYVNGVQVATVGTATISSINNNVGVPLHIARCTYNTARYFKGSLDEIRISNPARSASYILTCYNNQKDPTAFYIVGLEEKFEEPEPPVISDPYPQNGATGIELDPTLSATVTDYQADLMTIIFRTNATGTWQTIGTYANVGNGIYTQATTHMDKYETTYYWSVHATDGTAWTNRTYSFTTKAEPTNWWNTSWQYRRQIAIDHTEITEDQTDFPILIDLTDNTLSTKVQADGDDFVFTDNNGNKLSHQIETYDSAAGHLIAWLRIPYLSSTTDTIIYLYYGNPLAESQQNPTAVWDSSYKMVLHLGETTGTHYDSTSNGNNGSPYNGVVQGVTSKIDGFDSFDGVNDYVEVTHSGTITGFTTAFTASFWLKLEDTTRRQAILNKYNSAGNQRAWFIEFQTHATSGKVLGFFVSADGVNYRQYYASFNPTAGTWYYITVVWETNTIPKFYVNGVQISTIGTGTIASIFNNTGAPLHIGRSTYETNRYLRGSLDEIRISNPARSASYILACYNSQKDPLSFYTVSEEESLPSEPIVSNPSPDNVATNVPITLPELSFNLTDYQEPMNYYVSTYPDVGSGSDLGVSNGRYTITISGLQYLTAYTWHVNVTDGTHWTNVTYTFTTEAGVLTDPEFNDSVDSIDLRNNGAEQDWYESRGAFSGGDSTLLFLDTNDIGGDTSKKAGFTASTSANAYLSQDFGTPQTGTFTVQWDIYVDSIINLATGTDAAAWTMIGADLDGTNGPNSAAAERFVYMAFYKNGGATSGAVSLVCRQRGTNTLTTITSVNLDQWYTIKVVVNVAAGTYEVFVDGISYGTYTSRSVLSSVTHISFAQWNDGAGAFYVDNVFSPDRTRYKLTVTKVGSGTVQQNPGESTYAPDTVVTLTATPAEGWEFSGWSGDLTGDVNPTTITMDGQKSVTATFTEVAPPPSYDDVIFDSNFDMGNLRNVQYQSGDVSGNRLYSGEQNHTTVSFSDKHWWFYFSMDNVSGKTVTIKLVNNEAIDFSGNRWPEIEPIYSFDNINWERLPLSNVVVDSGALTFQMTVPSALTSGHSKIWLAPLPPYNIARRDALFAEFASSPYLTVTSLGTTPGLQELKVATITDPAYTEAGKIKAYVIAQQHAGEVPGSWEADGLIRFLLSDDPTAQAIRRSYIFRVVPITNVDGVYYGISRYTPLRSGVQYDLNRWWSYDISEMPFEIAKIFTDMQAFQPSSFNDMHSTINTEMGSPTDAVTYSWSTSDPTLVAFLNKIRDAGWPDTQRGTSGYACSQVHSRLGVARSISWENPMDEFITNPGHKLTVSDWRNMGRAYATGVYLDGGDRPNTVPTATNLQLTPANPSTSDVLTASYVYSDVEGDPESGTQIRWYKNSVLQSALNDLLTVSASLTIKGDIWYFTVTPKDGRIFGSTVQSSSVTVQNTSPSIDTFYPLDDPTIMEGESQKFNVTYSDVDGDTINVQWYLNGAPTVTSNTYIFTASIGSAGTYNVTVAISDGQSTASHEWTLVVLSVPNTPPEASGLTISPSNPKTNDDLVGSYTYYDADGDPESGTEIRWYRNGESVLSLNDVLTVPSSLTQKGDVWYFTVKPRDGKEFGTLQTSSTVTVLNTAPEASNLNITPSSPSSTDDLVANYVFSDIDGDVDTGSEIRWYKDGALQSGLNDLLVVSASYTARGEVWYFTVRPDDGTDYGDLQISASVTIQNSPPTIDSHYPATNPTILEGSSQEFNITYSDAEGDTIQIQWYLNNAPVSTNNKYIFTSDYASAGIYNITVAVSDGLAQVKYEWTLTVTDVGPVLDMPFDTNVSPTPDNSGYGNHGTVNGATWTTAGNGAYYFDGNDYIRIEDNVSLDGNGTWNQITIEFWLYMTAPSQNAKRIIAKRGSTSGTYSYQVGFQTANGRLYFDVWNPAVYEVEWTTVPSVNTWYHVVCVYTSGIGSKIYINGTDINAVKVGTGSISGNIAASRGQPLFLGCRYGTQDYFTGIMDNLKIFSKALPIEQIVLHYDTSKNDHVNKAPVITSFTPADPEPQVDEGQNLQFTHTSIDPERQSLTYSWLLDHVQQATTQNWLYTPDFDSAGFHNVTLVVSDGSLITTQYWNVEVIDVMGNVAPVVSNPEPADSTTDVSVSISTLNFTIDDANGDLMGYYVSTSPDVGSVSQTGVNDGTYSVSVSGLQYATVYTWWVNVTDGVLWTNTTHTFTTESIPLGVDISFDGASIGTYTTRANEMNFTLVTETLVTGEVYTYWTYFKVTNTLGREVTFRITNAAAVTFLSTASKEAQMVYSYDGDNWFRFTNHGYSGGIYTFTETFANNEVYVATFFPFSYTEMQDYENTVDASPWAVKSILGSSEQGRDVVLLKITNSSIPDTDKKVIYIIGRQHSAETASSHMLKGMIDFLISDNADARRMRNDFVWYIVPMVNPDGVYLGMSRATSEGRNANRDWKNSESVEINIVRDHINSINNTYGVDFFIDWHSQMDDASWYNYIYSPPGNTFFSILSARTDFDTQFSSAPDVGSPTDCTAREYISHNIVYNPMFVFEPTPHLYTWTIASLEQQGVNVAYAINEYFPPSAETLLVDSELDDSVDSADLRTNGAGQDWYESRGVFSGGNSSVLTLDVSDIGGNAGNKAALKNYLSPPMPIPPNWGNAYLTQGFSIAQTGFFTVSFDIYIDRIVDNANYDRAGHIYIGDDSITTNAPTGQASERFVLLAFYDPTPGDTGTDLELRARTLNTAAQAWATTSLWIQVATGLSYDTWYTIRIELNVASGTYDVYVNDVLKGDNISKMDAYPLSNPVRYVTFASDSDARGDFYVDNVFSPAIDRHKLTITVEGNGSVTIVPAESSYADGTEVELTAVADSGWYFSEWSGDLTGSQTPINIIMNGDKTITATFNEIPANFTIVVLPDTQFYSESYPGIFDNQTQWIVDNAAGMNILFVLHEGDLVNNDIIAQWDYANASMSLLDGNVPWAVLPGNHDGTNVGTIGEDLTNYNIYFPYSRFSGQTWYGGAYNNINTNNYVLFSNGEDDYIIFSFQYHPSDAILAWANTTIAAHSNRRAIVVTHDYLDVDGTRTTEGDHIWNSFVSHHADQIFVVLCGHMHGEASRQDTVNGHVVYQVLADYQERTPNGGNGWLRILEFHPVEDKIYVKTFSPYLNSYETDADSQFILDYEMTGSASTTTTLDISMDIKGYSGSIDTQPINTNSVLPFPLIILLTALNVLRKIKRKRN
jgi:murein tripeptide amidase MpaA